MVTTASPPANWYPDPDGGWGLRYWDGSRWTDFRTPSPYQQLPPNGAWGRPPWKGAQLGRPESGPQALAEPGRRLGARVLDLLLMLPVFALLVALALSVFGHRFGPMFPEVPAHPSNAPVPTPGFVWAYLTVVVCGFITGLVMLVYETVAVARFGRTLGMAWLNLRPLRVAGGPLGWGRAFGRAAIFWVAWLVPGWIGLLDPLWCLWDDKRQCLHDKVADSIVVNDG